ncbi:MAG TPA: FAD-dependent oxidoreductase [Planctomycetes bacterium]|nr:FAD-dependent oxidoreductase [Planctomycetota bacterium]
MESVQLTLPPSEDPPRLGAAELRRRAARKLRITEESIQEVRTRRVSFDARRRSRAWKLTVEVWLRGEAVPPGPRTTPPSIPRPSANAPRVVIVGSGPAGLFAALDLLEAGRNVTILERGPDVQTRRRSLRTLNRGGDPDPDSNYCFGEGGAGTYSDGKLYTRSGNKKAVRAVLETLVAHGAPTEILSSWRPHVGSNRLPEVVRAIRETIVAAGGEVCFRHRAEELERDDEGLCAVVARNLETGERERFETRACVLAAGHSALDVLEMARRAGAALAPKGFAMGVRVEHSQRWVDERQYGGLRGPCDLPAAFYELKTESRGRGVYSFCMCPGGFIVPATTLPAHVVVNGMSLSRRDSPFANSGLVVQIEPEDWCRGRKPDFGFAELLERAGMDASLPSRPEDDPLFGVRIQRALERLAARAGGGAGRAPAQRADIVAAGDRGTSAPLRTSYRPGLTAADLAEVLPVGILERLRQALVDFDGKLPGFASESGQLIGVESRTSSPVRILRDPDTLASPTLPGLFPAGEGAGYAGGIVSAALDGRRVARACVSPG